MSLCFLILNTWEQMERRDLGGPRKVLEHCLTGDLTIRWLLVMISSTSCASRFRLQRPIALTQLLSGRPSFFPQHYAILEIITTKCEITKTKGSSANLLAREKV